jgi:hypothetical protein
MKTKITMKDFLSDSQGRRFADVAADPHVQWAKWVAWLNDRARQDRLEMAEVHFNMPALAGILRELEAEPFVRDYFDRRTPQATLRAKQALGVLVKAPHGGAGVGDDRDEGAAWAARRGLLWPRGP